MRGSSGWLAVRKNGLGPAEAAGGRFKQPGQLRRPAAHGAHRCLAGGAAAPRSARPGAAYLQLPAAAGMETWFELIRAARGPSPGTARCNKETALRGFARPASPAYVPGAGPATAVRTTAATVPAALPGS